MVFFVAIWLSFERFHLNWEFTWPWLNLGNAFSEYPQLIQWYDTIGATGGSFWILLINVFAFYTLRIWQAGRIRKDLVKNISILTAIIVLPLLISIYKYNSYQEKPVGEVTTLLLQPKLDPYIEKYSKDSLQILGELLSLAEENSKTKVDFFIAPETAGPDNLPAKSPVAYTFVAPCSPRAPAIAVASPPTNAVTDEPIERAFASNSRVPVVGTSPLACANTQMLLIVIMLSLDHFQVFEVCNDFFKC